MNGVYTGNGAVDAGKQQRSNSSMYDNGTSAAPSVIMNGGMVAAGAAEDLEKKLHSNLFPEKFDTFATATKIGQGMDVDISPSYFTNSPAGQQDMTPKFANGYLNNGYVMTEGNSRLLHFRIPQKFSDV